MRLRSNICRCRSAFTAEKTFFRSRLKCIAIVAFCQGVFICVYAFRYQSHLLSGRGFDKLRNELLGETGGGGGGGGASGDKTCNIPWSTASEDFQVWQMNRLNKYK